MNLIKTNRPFSPRLYAFTYEGLYAMRIERRLSLPQIARKFGCDHTTVLNALGRLGIPTKRPLVPADLPAGKGWVKEATSQQPQADAAPKVAPESRVA